ncbi:TIR-only protein [Manihot esculenta]|uniref:TIR domain-containing protein n=1 Tax=Manihot esculenta TaxID=3983 RepID=A0A2C9UF33_MANES|nr:TIR-only protein [Manihot esculenta]OAY28660.1 hypothetical protein MANES_15G084900v8 [Manihot esculenta]
MHRSSVVKFQRQFLTRASQTQMTMNRVIKPCDVFINHRGIDTKRTVATLLYDHLSRLALRPFLDNKNMKPGDKLFENINTAIRQCKIGVAVLSPRYCDSYFCLHELALIMESKKKVIPIFCDIKPSQLRIVDKGLCSAKEMQRFNWALEETKYTVGLTFDSLKGNWSEVVTNASDIVIRSLIEMENEKQMSRRKIPMPA